MYVVLFVLVLPLVSQIHLQDFAVFLAGRIIV